MPHNTYIHEKKSSYEQSRIMDRIYTRFANDLVIRKWQEIAEGKPLPQHHAEIKTHGGKKGLIHFWRTV